MQINKAGEKIIASSVFKRYMEIQSAYSGVEEIFFSDFTWILYTHLCFTVSKDLLVKAFDTPVLYCDAIVTYFSLQWKISIKPWFGQAGVGEVSSSESILKFLLELLNFKNTFFFKLHLI